METVNQKFESSKKSKKGVTVELIDQQNSGRDDLDRLTLSGKEGLEKEPLLDEPAATERPTDDLLLAKTSEKTRKEIEEILPYSSSLNHLIWIIISTYLFQAVITNASQKYIQYNLQGDASDLATLGTFKNMAVLFTPFLGILMDKFYPMRLRIGPYLVVTELVQIGCLLLIGTARLSKSVFMLLLAIYTCGNLLTAAVTQAVIAMKTKLDIKLNQKNKELESLEEEAAEDKRVDQIGAYKGKESEAIGIEIYAMFSVFGSIFGGLSPVLGGLLVDYLPNVKHVFLVVMTPNVALLVFAIIFLKEKRETTSFPEGRSLREIFSGAFKVITGKNMLLPILIVMLMNLTPTMAQAISFVIINKVGWSYTQMGSVLAFKTAFMAGVLIQLKRSSKNFRFDLMIFVGILVQVGGRVLEVPLAYPIFDGFEYSIFFFVYGTVFELFSFFTDVALSGRLNTLIMKGLEGSATNTLRAILALNSTIAGVLSAYEMTAFGVKGGYYERVRVPLVINLTYAVVIISLSSVFLAKTYELRAQAEK